ncbi:AvrD family protein [Streptomyces sodiiphilus]|uniref:AvrD family protein n=1 Tax=Streptomyces sodiiphilus TaxID=226217 RepID=A0ABN2P2F7_9ACTN
MTTSPPTTPTALASVDDFLGDRAERFFGEGFKRVRHSLTDIAVHPALQGGTIDATAGLSIPGTWSRKGETGQRPHLSTIDVMLYGAQLTGLYLAHAHGYGRQAVFGVRSLTIKAGRKPQEDGLATFSVSGRHLSTETVAPGTAVTAMECRIGLLTVQVEVEHPAEGEAGELSSGHYGSADALPGRWNDAPFGVSHRVRSQLLTAVEADTQGLTATADLLLTDDGNSGDAAADRPSMIDLFVSALQLGQLLLYSLDDVSRADSNTLWMRRTTIAPAGAPSGERFGTRLANARLLPTKQGTWRSADIVTTFGGWHLECSVAHLLPRPHR